jgi:hypothetical protein
VFTAWSNTGLERMLTFVPLLQMKFLMKLFRKLCCGGLPLDAAKCHVNEEVTKNGAPAVLQVS